MTVQNPKFLSTTAAGNALGVTKTTIWRICIESPGFGFQLRDGGGFRIPESHVQRILNGEKPADIAAEARARGQHAA
jgi:hypothetical protein